MQEKQHHEAEEEPHKGHLHPCIAPQAGCMELPAVSRASGYLTQGSKSVKARKLTRESTKKEMSEERSMCVFGFVTEESSPTWIHSSDSCAGCLNQPFQARAAERGRENGCVKGVPRWKKDERTGKRK